MASPCMDFQNTSMRIQKFIPVLVLRLVYPAYFTTMELSTISLKQHPDCDGTPHIIHP